MDFLQMLRMASIFGNPQQNKVPSPYGNDLPSQGGITGTQPIPGNELPDPIFNPAQSRPNPGINFGVNPINPAMMPPPMPGPQAPDMSGGEDPRRMEEMIARLYTPEHEASDKFNQLVDAYPTHQEPGKLRKIGASITGALTDLGHAFGNQGGPTGKSVFDDVTGKTKYNEDVTDWKNKVTPAQRAAELERLTNVNERTTAIQTATQQLTAERNAAVVAKNAEAVRQADEKIALLKFKQDHPDFEFSDKGPTVRAYNRRTGEIHDTGFKTGNLDDMTRLSILQRDRMALAEKKEQLDDKWTVTNVAMDPSKPTELTAVWYNPETRETQPFVAGSQSPALARPIGAGGAGSMKQPANLEAIQQMTQRTLGLMDLLRNPTTGKLTPEVQQNVGASRMTGQQYIPGDWGTRAGDAKINNFKSTLLLELIGELKAQSRTGATGFGQLSIRELGVLEAAASQLDPLMEEAEFEAELRRIEERLKKILQPATSLNPTVTPNKPKASDLINKYGKGAF